MLIFLSVNFDLDSCNWQWYLTYQQTLRELNTDLCYDRLVHVPSIHLLVSCFPVMNVGTLPSFRVMYIVKWLYSKPECPTQRSMAIEKRDEEKRNISTDSRSHSLTLFSLKHVFFCSLSWLSATFHSSFFILLPFSPWSSAPLATHITQEYDTHVEYVDTDDVPSEICLMYPAHQSLFSVVSTLVQYVSLWKTT